MSAMEPAHVALIVIAWVLLDAIIVAGLVLVRLRGERRVRRAGQQLAAEAERYVNAVAQARRSSTIMNAAWRGSTLTAARARRGGSG
jgi:hypothetical protein